MVDPWKKNVTPLSPETRVVQRLTSKNRTPAPPLHASPTCVIFVFVFVFYLRRKKTETDVKWKSGTMYASSPTGRPDPVRLLPWKVRTTTRGSTPGLSRTCSKPPNSARPTSPTREWGNFRRRWLGRWRGRERFYCQVIVDVGVVLIDLELLISRMACFAHVPFCSYLLLVSYIVVMGDDIIWFFSTCWTSLTSSGGGGGGGREGGILVVSCVATHYYRTMVVGIVRCLVGVYENYTKWVRIVTVLFVCVIRDETDRPYCCFVSSHCCGGVNYTSPSCAIFFRSYVASQCTYRIVSFWCFTVLVSVSFPRPNPIRISLAGTLTHPCIRLLPDSASVRALCTPVKGEDLPSPLSPP